MNNYASLLVTVPITVVLAALSWHLVERPTLRWAGKRRERDQKQPSVSAVPLDS
jgi:peptidoglycan/LPS O-acetylase OafA/YrhL